MGSRWPRHQPWPPEAPAAQKRRTLQPPGLRAEHANALRVASHSPLPTDWQIRGDPVTVAVSSHGGCCSEPEIALGAHVRWRTEPTYPRLAGSHRFFDERPRPGFDEVLALGDGLTIILAHRSEWFGDQPGDHAGAQSAATRARVRQFLQAIPEHRSYVFGVVQTVLGHDPRHESVEVMVVRLGTSQRGGEWAEGARLNDRRQTTKVRT